YEVCFARWVAEGGWAIERQRPRFAVIYEDNFNYLSKMCLLRMREAALEMIDAAKARGVPVVVAGADATDHADTYLDRGAQVVIAGEGEVTLVEVLDTLTGARAGTLSSIDGVWLRGSDGRLVRTAAREIVRHLDALPMPAWDLIDVAKY